MFSEIKVNFSYFLFCKHLAASKSVICTYFEVGRLLKSLQSDNCQHCVDSNPDLDWNQEDDAMLKNWNHLTEL